MNYVFVVVHGILIGIVCQKKTNEKQPSKKHL